MPSKLEILTARNSPFRNSNQVSQRAPRREPTPASVTAHVRPRLPRASSPRGTFECAPHTTPHPTKTHALRLSRPAEPRRAPQHHLLSKHYTLSASRNRLNEGYHELLGNVEHVLKSLVRFRITLFLHYRVSGTRLGSFITTASPRSG